MDNIINIKPNKPKIRPIIPTYFKILVIMLITSSEKFLLINKIYLKVSPI